MQITTIEQALAAGESKIFPVSGRYFRLMATLRPVDVHFGFSSRFHEKLEQVEAGAWAKTSECQSRVLREHGFTHVKVVSATAQTVKFVTSDGEAGYDRVFVGADQSLAGASPSAVVVGTSEVPVLAAGSRKRVIFTAHADNIDRIFLHPGDVASSEAIPVWPGEMWIETLAPSLAWNAHSQTADQILEVLTFS